MHHPSPQHLNRPTQLAALRSGYTPALRRSHHRNPLPRQSSKGPSARPASLLPTVLVTALALGALLWAVPHADGEAAAMGQPFAMPVGMR